jgi:hypothetical protein
MTCTYAEEIEAHYIKRWSPPITSLRLTRGRIHELPSDFSVLLFRRSPDTIAYATRCMSQPGDPVALEIHVLCRPDRAGASSLDEILTALAHYHRTGSPLGVGHSVNFGKPWVSGSSCSYGLLSLPYLDGPSLEWLEQPRVRFLWLIPVTEAEIAFKKASGTEALEQRFEQAQFDYLDPYRPSVV